MSSKVDWEAHNKALIKSPEFREAIAEHVKHLKQTVVAPFRKAVGSAKTPQEVRNALKKYYNI